MHVIAGGNTQTEHIQVVFHLLPLSKSLLHSLHLSHVLGVLTQNFLVTTSEHVFLKPVFCRDLLFHLLTGFTIALCLCIRTWRTDKESVAFLPICNCYNSSIVQVPIPLFMFSICFALNITISCSLLSICSRVTTFPSTRFLIS